MWLLIILAFIFGVAVGAAGLFGGVIYTLGWITKKVDKKTVQMESEAASKTLLVSSLKKDEKLPEKVENQQTMPNDKEIQNLESSLDFSSSSSLLTSTNASSSSKVPLSARLSSIDSESSRSSIESSKRDRSQTLDSSLTTSEDLPLESSNRRSTTTSSKESTNISSSNSTNKPTFASWKPQRPNFNLKRFDSELGTSTANDDDDDEEPVKIGARGSMVMRDDSFAYRVSSIGANSAAGEHRRTTVSIGDAPMSTRSHEKASKMLGLDVVDLILSSSPSSFTSSTLPGNNQDMPLSPSSSTISGRASLTSSGRAGDLISSAMSTSHPHPSQSLFPSSKKHLDLDLDLNSSSTTAHSQPHSRHSTGIPSTNSSKVTVTKRFESTSLSLKRARSSTEGEADVGMSETKLNEGLLDASNSESQKTFRMSSSTMNSQIISPGNVSVDPTKPANERFEMPAKDKLSSKKNLTIQEAVPIRLVRRETFIKEARERALVDGQRRKLVIEVRETFGLKEAYSSSESSSIFVRVAVCGQRFKTGYAQRRNGYQYQEMGGIGSTTTTTSTSTSTTSGLGGIGIGIGTTSSSTSTSSVVNGNIPLVQGGNGSFSGGIGGVSSTTMIEQTIPSITSSSFSSLPSTPTLMNSPTSPSYPSSASSSTGQITSTIGSSSSSSSSSSIIPGFGIGLGGGGGRVKWGGGEMIVARVDNPHEDVIHFEILNRDRLHLGLTHTKLFDLLKDGQKDVWLPLKGNADQGKTKVNATGELRVTLTLLGWEDPIPLTKPRGGTINGTNATNAHQQHHHHHHHDESSSTSSSKPKMSITHSGTNSQQSSSTSTSKSKKKNNKAQGRNRSSSTTNSTSTTDDGYYDSSSSSSSSSSSGSEDDSTMLDDSIETSLEDSSFSISSSSSLPTIRTSVVTSNQPLPQQSNNDPSKQTSTSLLVLNDSYDPKPTSKKRLSAVIMSPINQIMSAINLQSSQSQQSQSITTSSTTGGMTQRSSLDPSSSLSGTFTSQSQQSHQNHQFQSSNANTTGNGLNSSSLPPHQSISSFTPQTSSTSSSSSSMLLPPLNSSRKRSGRSDSNAPPPLSLQIPITSHSQSGTGSTSSPPSPLTSPKPISEVLQDQQHEQTFPTGSSSSQPSQTSQQVLSSLATCGNTQFTPIVVYESSTSSNSVSSPSSSQTYFLVGMQGWTNIKLSFKQSKYENRWCVLDGNVLKIFEDMYSKASLAILPLLGCKVWRLATKKHHIKIQLAKDSGAAFASFQMKPLVIPNVPESTHISPWFHQINHARKLTAEYLMDPPAMPSSGGGGATNQMNSNSNPSLQSNLQSLNPPANSSNPSTTSYTGVGGTGDGSLVSGLIGGSLLSSSSKANNHSLGTSSKANQILSSNTKTNQQQQPPVFTKEDPPLSPTILTSPNTSSPSLTSNSNPSFDPKQHRISTNGIDSSGSTVSPSHSPISSLTSSISSDSDSLDDDDEEFFSGDGDEDDSLDVSHTSTTSSSNNLTSTDNQKEGFEKMTKKEKKKMAKRKKMEKKKKEKEEKLESKQKEDKLEMSKEKVSLLDTKKDQSSSFGAALLLTRGLGVDDMMTSEDVPLKVNEASDATSISAITSSSSSSDKSPRREAVEQQMLSSRNSSSSSTAKSPRGRMISSQPVGGVGMVSTLGITSSSTSSLGEKNLKSPRRSSTAGSDHLSSHHQQSSSTTSINGSSLTSIGEGGGGGSQTSLSSPHLQPSSSSVLQQQQSNNTINTINIISSNQQVISEQGNQQSSTSSLLEQHHPSQVQPPNSLGIHVKQRNWRGSVNEVEGKVSVGAPTPQLGSKKEELIFGVETLMTNAGLIREDEMMEYIRKEEEEERRAFVLANVTPLKRIPDHVPPHDPGFLNLVLWRLFRDMQTSELFANDVSEKIRAKIETVKLPPFLGNLRVIDTDYGKDFIKLESIKVVATEDPDEVIIETDINYEGGLSVTLGIECYINWPRPKAAVIPVTATIKLVSLRGKLHILLPSTLNTKNSLCFVSPPNVEFDVSIDIGKGEGKRVSSIPKLKHFLFSFARQAAFTALVHPSRILWFWPIPGRKVDVELSSHSDRAKTKKPSKGHTQILSRDSSDVVACKYVALEFFNNILNLYRYERLDQLFSADCIVHGTSFLDVPLRGRDAVLSWIVQLRHSFPDIRYFIDELNPSKNNIAIQWTARGTFLNDLWDYPATGAELLLRGSFSMKVRDGNQLITEFFVFWSLGSIYGLV
jgi:hypothetical protein